MKLNENNYILFAAKCYDNPNCESMDEFISDLNRIKYVKKLFSIYKKTGDLRARLILNHLVIIYNVFSPPTSTTKMLFYRLDGYWDCLIPFLLFLGYLPERIDGVGERGYVISDEIIMDFKVAETVKRLIKEG